MRHAKQSPQKPIKRRDFLGAGAGIAAIATGIAAQVPADAQSEAQPSVAAPPPLPTTNSVIVERRPGGILTIGLDRPEAQNRIDPAMLLAIGKALYRLEHDDALRVAVLYATGPNFASGLDVPAYIAAARAGQILPKDPEFLQPLNLAPPLRTTPLVVAVRGAVRTVGHELMLAGDIRVAASDAVFAQNELKVGGIFPFGGATIRFPREAGWGNAMRYILTADDWSADEAYRLGLVQAVTPPGQQVDRALAFAGKIAAAPPLAVRAALVSARQTLAGEAPALAALAPAAAKIRASADYQEFQAALREKRPPVYRGL
jgi:enoyl-CoA hydratase/carnithine racemase